MNQDLKELTDVFNQEMRKFILSFDFSLMKQKEEVICTKISEYLNQKYKNFLRFDTEEISDKIRENFGYSISKGEQSLKGIHSTHFETMENFKQKMDFHRKERKSILEGFDSNQTNNHFSDLDSRISEAIDQYLGRRNYDNQNYERFRFQIKTAIRNYIKDSKNQILNQVHKSATIQSDILDEQVQAVANQILKKAEDLSLESISSMENTAIDLSTSNISYTPEVVDFVLESKEEYENSKDNEYGSLPGNVIL